MTKRPRSMEEVADGLALAAQAAFGLEQERDVLRARVTALMRERDEAVAIVTKFVTERKCADCHGDTLPPIRCRACTENYYAHLRRRVEAADALYTDPADALAAIRAVVEEAHCAVNVLAADGFRRDADALRNALAALERVGLGVQ